MTGTVHEHLERGPWGWVAGMALAAIVACSGCGPIQVASAVGDAEEAIGAAQSVEAQRYARYEYWMAILYLEKAKRIDGRAEYMAATEFAAEAVKFAGAAVEVAGKEKMRQQVMKQRLDRVRKGKR